jgi:hypothetical protein
LIKSKAARNHPRRFASRHRFSGVQWVHSDVARSPVALTYAVAVPTCAVPAVASTHGAAPSAVPGARTFGAPVALGEMPVASDVVPVA